MTLKQPLSSLKLPAFWLGWRQSAAFRALHDSRSRILLLVNNAQQLLRSCLTQIPVCRTGKYYDAALANINAYNADLVFGQNCLLPYEPEHNTDMLIFAASMGGQVCRWTSF